jgi:UDP-N-acetylglucosamine--N-acetylmuramyl-(pentapeptide) pyrophosphoryl-undecaprenol N-acetylglucosamine transferase
MKMVNKRIIIGGGGTGGHIFPAIAIANSLKKIDTEIELLFVGAKGKIEMEKVPLAGYRIIGLPVSGFQRRLSVKNLVFFVKLLKCVLMSRKIIKEFNPSVAIGVGGYASGPIIRAAARKKVPVVLQEQNSYAGITNRILARSAQKICVAYEGMEKFFPGGKILLTGNPVRNEIINLKPEKKEAALHFNLSPELPVLLVTGGSLGARTINESISGNLDLLPEKIQLIWQCGKGYFDEMQAQLAKSVNKSIILK